MSTQLNWTALSEAWDTPLAPPGRMSEDEFERWRPDKPRCEWVDGEVIMMSPVTTDHGDLNRWLLAVLGFFTTEFDLGAVLGPEVQIRLAGQRRRRTPDLLFVVKQRLNLIRETFFEGAPDLIMEIVSPESQSRDWREKFLEYQAAGVREYWIIDPLSRRLEVYALDADQHYQLVVERDGAFHSTVVSGFFLKSQWLWQFPRPRERDVLREMGLPGM